MSDALDALAPAAPSAPAPQAPSPAPASSPPSAAPPASVPDVAASPPAAAPAAPPDSAAELQRLAQSLGYQSADEYKADLAFARRARAEYERRAYLERQNDPGVQQAARRGEALRALMAEGYNSEVADALPALPEISQFLADQRADHAQRVMTEALGEIGIRSDGTKESQELLADIEDRMGRTLNHDLRLNRLYHGTPADRAACIQELVAVEERYLNRHLLRQNAQTLRDHAAKASQLPRAGRSVTATPRVRDEKPTSTDPVQRRREGNAIVSRQLDDIFGFHN